MTLRSVMADVEAILVEQGCSRAKHNFNLELVPRSTIHKSYTLGRAAIAPRYLASNIADYLGTSLEILVAWKVHGDHNSAGTFAEGYLDLIDFYETLETALVKSQLQSNQENNIIQSAGITSLIIEEEQDFLLLQLNIVLDALREM